MAELLSQDDGKRVTPNTATTTQYVKAVEALRDYHNSEVEYKDAYTDLKAKKAKVLHDLDPKTDFPNISRPTVDDKKAFITVKCQDEIAMVAMLEAERNFKKELYELEKIMLQMEMI